jgi:hypothetical protein
MADTKRTDAGPDALEEFLRESEAFLSSTLDGIMKAIGDADDAPLIEAHSGAAREQLGKLTQHVRLHYERANVELRREVDEFMQTQSATTLARNGQEAFKKVSARGLFGDGIFSWIEAIMQEIKKIHEWLTQMFNLPSWLSKLFQLLDQIVKALLGLFGGVLGRNRSKIMTELSSMEVGFWNELGAHKRFVLLGSPAQAEED